MLETIPSWSRAHRGGSEGNEVRDRHLGFFLQLVERGAEADRAEQRQWYDRPRGETTNLREALAYACESRDGERALMLAGTICVSGEPGTCRRGVASGTSGRSPSARTHLRRREREACFGMAHMVDAGGDFERSRALFEEPPMFCGRSVTRAGWCSPSPTLRDVHLPRRYAACSGNKNDEALDLADRSGDARGAASSGRTSATLLMSVDDRRAGPLIERAARGLPLRSATRTG